MRAYQTTTTTNPSREQLAVFSTETTPDPCPRRRVSDTLQAFHIEHDRGAFAVRRNG
jgi:hypothetical protein